MITLEQFARIIPSNKEAAEWHEIALDLFPKYKINTTNRIAGFMAQCAHESTEFKRLEENMNYSWQQLRKVFKRYFTTDAIAKLHERKPEQIANIVYNDANRINKLGNTQTGDGWKFRGGGIKQLTGRWNYGEFGKSINMNADEAVAYVRTKRGAFESALWFWSENDLNDFADKDDIEGMSRRINGGKIGMADRKRRYASAKTILGTVVVPKQPEPKSVSANSSFKVLKRGTRSADVQKLQKGFRISADGIFGIQTESFVRSWQRKNKYTVTGQVDEKQFKEITE